MSSTSLAAACARSSALLGPEGARGIERGLAPWFRALLVPQALPRVPGVVERLEAGIRVADVGCGAGVALLEMAKAFPRSEFHGYDKAHQEWKAAVLAGELALEDIDTEQYNAYSLQSPVKESGNKVTTT